jgi:metabolite-proton symporter
MSTQMRRVLLSSYLGSTVEFYDFLLYGTAASLVFGQLFFSRLDPATGTIAAFGTLAAGYLARPLGGILFGHFGDRIGRKSMLVTTMTLMGACSTLIGLLPTYRQIGIWAPILLVTLRVLQGIAVGGEWGGAALMSMEHAKADRRGFAASVTNMGAPSGALLATLVLTAFSTLPDQQFLAWGWRIPFLLSAVLVAVGLWVRLSVTESPVFAAAVARAERPAVPLFEVLRHYPKSIVSAALGTFSMFTLQSLLATFALGFAVSAGGHSRTTVLVTFSIGSLLQIFALGFYAHLSDRIGRRPVMIAGAVAAVVLAYPIFWLISQGSTVALLLGFVIGMPVVQAAMYGPSAAFISEMFGTTSRYTGASLGYQISSTLGGGFAPLIAASLAAAGGFGRVALFASATALVSAVVIAMAKESSRSDLAQVGNQPQPAPPVVVAAANA